jgi:hypothetical protein
MFSRIYYETSLNPTFGTTHFTEMPRQQSEPIRNPSQRQATSTGSKRTAPEAGTEFGASQHLAVPPEMPPSKRPRQQSAKSRAQNSNTQSRISTASTSKSTIRDDNPDVSLSEPSYRTLRISLIPTSVTELQLREWLGSLSSDKIHGYVSAAEKNVLELSLAAYNRWQTATVTFLFIPQELTKCNPGSKIEVQAEIGGVKVVIVIDCDFWGFTPLYSCPAPSVE